MQPCPSQPRPGPRAGSADLGDPQRIRTTTRPRALRGSSLPRAALASWLNALPRGSLPLAGRVADPVLAGRVEALPVARRQCHRMEACVLGRMRRDRSAALVDLRGQRLDVAWSQTTPLCGGPSRSPPRRSLDPAADTPANLFQPCAPNKHAEGEQTGRTQCSIGHDAGRVAIRNRCDDTGERTQRAMALATTLNRHRRSPCSMANRAADARVEAPILA